jgi:hypothetical protein
VRDDGVSYGDYVEQLPYLIFLKMDDENTLLGKRSAGQYFTPRALIKAIVDVMRPAAGDTIADQAAGSGVAGCAYGS